MRHERHLVPTDAGLVLSAEAILPDAPAAAVVITHPHPLHGGSMHTPVPTALFERAGALGLAAVRFDFRGVGASTGTHDEGRGERDDVRAVMAWLRDQLADPDRAELPLLLAGWSFGADVILAVDDRVAGWFTVAAPLAIVDVDEMLAPVSAAPKWLVVPEHDQFRSPVSARAVTARWSATTVHEIGGADHFVAGSLDEVADTFEDFVVRG